MKKLLILFAVFGILPVMYAIPTFQDTFANSSYIESTTAYRSGGKLYIGYPDIYYPSRAWYYKWGDIAYYNGNIYVTWADDRYNGVYTVFVQKLSASDGTTSWSTNFIVGEITNKTMFPTISVFDSSHIYVGFRRDADGHSYLYSAKIDDSGASPVLSLYERLDNTLADNVHYYPQKNESTVDAAGDFYVMTTWGYIGSGNYEDVYKADASLNGKWGNGFRTINKIFTIANDIAYMDGYLYTSGEHWMWSPSRDEGSYSQKVSTNDSTSRQWGDYNDADGRDSLSSYYRWKGLHNSVAVDTNNNVIYYCWADHRNGDEDVFINKLDTSGNLISWSPSV